MVNSDVGQFSNRRIYDQYFFKTIRRTFLSAVIFTQVQSIRHRNLFILGTQCGYGGKFDVDQFFIKVTSVTRNKTLSI